MCKRKHTRVIMAVSSPAAGDKSQQDTKGEGQSVTLGEVCDPLQEPCEFCNLHKQGNMDYVWK